MGYRRKEVAMAGRRDRYPNRLLRLFPFCFFEEWPPLFTGVELPLRENLVVVTGVEAEIPRLLWFVDELMN